MRVHALRAPAGFALRRLRSRPLSLAALVLALAGAGALVGSSGLTAALAQERSVHVELRSLPLRYRSIHVRYYTLPLEADFRAPRVEGALGSFAAVTTPPRRVQVWHSITPNEPDGMRLVTASAPHRDVMIAG